ncbi:MAG: hypothetical protein AAB930_03915 [Patescibacteria group bacterium]
MARLVKKIFKIIKALPRLTYYLLGGSPAGYWNWLVVFFILGFISSVAFGAYVFVSTSKITSATIDLPDERRTLTVDRKGLAAAVEIIDRNALDYSRILTSPVLSDPSL